MPAWLMVAIQEWMKVPTVVQAIALATVGLCGGALANHAITTWCWLNRPSSPWADGSKWKFDEPQSAIQRSLPHRTWLDRIPVCGWWRLRRESTLYGRGHWVRPLLIELGLAAALPIVHAAYFSGGLLPVDANPATVTACGPWMTWLFINHAWLLVVMVAATFIDFDERTIPDSLTLPGTLLALTMASISPLVFLPGVNVNGLSPVTVNSPGRLLTSWMSSAGLVTCLFIWSVFCFALADRRWIARRGFRKAVDYFVARLFRHWTWKLLLGIWIGGCVGILVVYQLRGLHWLGLSTALAGLAVGGGMIWAIRLIGKLALGREAMGFGDVTLMAMIGAVIGWQASIAAFFLSPIVAIVFVLGRFLVTRDGSTPYGPYLCAGTMLTIAFWDPIYNGNLSMTLLMLDGALLWFAGAMLLLMLAMLWVMRLAKEMWLARRSVG